MRARNQAGNIHKLHGGGHQPFRINQLGEFEKPAGLFSVDGYYEPFMGFIDHMISQAFLPAAHRNSIVLASDPRRLLDGLINFRRVDVPKWM